MGLSKPGVSVDKEWIVNFSRGLTYCVGSSSSKLIRLADYKKIKSVTLTKWRGATPILCERRFDSDGRINEKIHLRKLLPLFVDAEYHIHRQPEAHRSTP